jgi:hypothetical protein
MRHCSHHWWIVQSHYQALGCYWSTAYLNMTPLMKLECNTNWRIRKERGYDPKQIKASKLHRIKVVTLLEICWPTTALHTVTSG